jgi:signal transduction histidine kinase/HPt (histidine-containing phosphotransfer) domain-containing protein
MTREQELHMKILVAEDDALSLISLKRKLESWGYEVVVAKDGSQAWDVVLQDSPRIVILDWMMPGLDGIDVCRHIRTAENLPYIYVILLSAKEQDQDLLAGFDAGADDYMVKPFDEHILRRRVAVGARVAKYEEELKEKDKRLAEATANAENMALVARNTRNNFLNNMSHEIRTPMNGIMNMIDLVLDAGHLCEEDRDCLCTAKRSIVKLLQLINDILDLSKIETNRLEVKMLPCDLNKIIEAVWNLRLPANDKGLDFDIVFETAVPQRINTDPARLTQCLINLVGNAVKFTESGSINIRVSLQYETAEPHIRFDVIDTGIGIPLDKQSLILDKFTQADGSTTRAYGGTGLGLAITKQLTELLGGELSISSRGGKGATFSLSVPANIDVAAAAMLSNCCRQDVEKQDDKQSIGNYSLSGTILVAEDDFANQKGIRAILSRGGATVEIAANGLEAVEKVSSGSYDLVLMDMQMPKMSGYDATNTLRKSGFDLPIIALTANAMKGDAEKCIEAGCDAYLSKPIDIKKLFALLERYLASNVDEPVDETDKREAEKNVAGRDVSHENQIVDRSYSKRELETRLEELLQADSRKNDFLASMSHDIRTPIAGMVSLIELALDEENLSRQLRDYLSSANTSAHSLLQLINDILDISKIEAGRLDVDIVDSSLIEILYSVDLSIRTRAAEKGIDFNTELLSAIPEQIKTDPTRVHQCLLNLLSNAVKFTETGGVMIKISLEPRDGRDFVRFDIVDTGIGIPAAKQECIFTKYRQADTSTSRTHGGTGLGLAITKRLANLLDGDLTLVSQPGQGSTFSLLIPANVDVASAAMTTHLDCAQQAKQYRKSAFSHCQFTGRVLIAEDDLANQKGIQAIMKKVGLETEVAEDGLEVVEKVTRASYDLVLMDMQMPKMSGYDATRTLRRSGFELPIIALTANAMKGDTEKCLQAGCDAYMAKPIELKNLFTMLNRFLQGSSKDIAPANSPISEGDRFNQETSANRGAAQHKYGEQCTEPTINWPELEERFGDDDVIKEIVEAWFVDNPARIQALAEGINARNLEDIQTLSHTLKGSAALIGAGLLFAPALELNHAAQKGHLEDAEVLFETIQSEFDNLKSFVSQPDWMETAKQQCAQIESVKQA